MVREGEIYQLTVEGYASQGLGVGRVDGQAVFVKGALRGERCAVYVEHVGHAAAWARVEELLEPSPRRLAPDCPYYARCGGCQLRHMTYDEELAFKAEKVRAALERIGGQRQPEAVPIHAAAATDGYRNKVQFPVAPGPRIGFYAQGSHRVAEVKGCRLQSPAAEALRSALGRWMETFHVPAYDERSRRGVVRHLYVREAGGQALAVVVANGSLPRQEELVQALKPHAAGVLVNVNTAHTNVVLGPRTRLLWGVDSLEEELCGLRFRLSPQSFFQVNRDQAEVLYTLAGEFAGLTGAETLLDLYCGTGTIGLTMASRARELIGVEVVPQAVRDARENAARNGIQNARFLLGDAGQAARQLAEEGVRPQVVVVDPPRKGLAPGVADTLMAMGPERLVYVSCDPATLARDVKALGGRYRLERAEAVDMFPRTFHVETVCLMSKADK